MYPLVFNFRMSFCRCSVYSYTPMRRKPLPHCFFSYKKFSSIWNWFFISKVLVFHIVLFDHFSISSINPMFIIRKESLSSFFIKFFWKCNWHFFRKLILISINWLQWILSTKQMRKALNCSMPMLCRTVFTFSIFTKHFHLFFITLINFNFLYSFW